MSHAERVVIVTGGSKGLGFAIIERLLADGYAVATCSRRITNALEHLVEKSTDGRLLWYECEAGNEPSQARFMDAVREWSSGRTLFALVNNAGIAGEGILAIYPNVDSEAIIRVNVLGTIRMSRLFLRSILKTGTRLSGRIVNISSIVGTRGYKGLSVYAASKAAIDGFTRSLAREVGTRHITVNSIAPGYLETDLSASLRPEQRLQVIGRTPMGRLGKVSDVVPAVQFLLSDGAAFITGQTLVVDGGLTC